MEATQARELTLTKRIEVFMAKRAIEAMRKKRFTVFMHHSVQMYEEYSINYIDNAVSLQLANVRISD